MRVLLLLVMMLSLCAQDVTKSGGLTNGHGWKLMTENEKLLYVISFNEGLKVGINLIPAAAKERQEANMFLINPKKKMTYAILLKELNDFYEKNDNLIIPFSGAMACLSMNSFGASVDTIDSFRIKLIESATHLKIREMEEELRNQEETPF